MTNWNAFDSWNLVLPPSRPSWDQLKNIHIAIDNIKRDMPVAVLGSTPEFRDLFRNLGFKNVYIFEKNMEFYTKMKKLMATDGNNEILIEGDWLDTISQYSNFFSVILSDLTMGNIPYNYRQDFYKSINNSLDKRGKFIDKILTHDFFNNFDCLIYEFSRKPLNIWTANEFNCRMLFCSELVHKEKMVNTTDIYYYLNKRVKEKWMQELLKLTKLITPEEGIWYYGKLRNEVEQDYLRCFTVKIINNEPLASPYYMYARHYYFEKKEV